MPEPTLFRLPKLYENMDEATVGEWFVTPGETVEKGQLLVELITDKTVLEYEAPETGTLLAVYAKPKSTVPIGYVLAAIGEPGQAAPDVAAENARILAEASPDVGLAVPPPPPAAPEPWPASTMSTSTHSPPRSARTK
jgi:pyruvate/2-oxoglutarate dehydrogenase complex dihydrolipoamide acyltransferase (E2) component